MAGRELPKVPDTVRLRGRYHVKVALPESVRKHWGGKAVYQKSLRTSDPATARKEAGAIRAIINAQLDRAKAEDGWKALARNLPPDQKALLENAGGLSGLLKQFEAGKIELAFAEAGKPAGAGEIDFDGGRDGEPVPIMTGGPEDAPHPRQLRRQLAGHRGEVEEVRAQTNADGRVLRKLKQDVGLVGDVFGLRDLVEDWAPSVDAHTAENARTYVSASRSCTARLLSTN